MIINKLHIAYIAPKIKTDILGVLPKLLNEFCPKYGINTPVRMAAFLAQVAHESGGFNVLQEDLNYRADRLQEVFRKYFPSSELAAAYAGKPEAIANRVYASRIGNGPESSGDGWRYRGRGFIQLTGRSNYATCSKDIYGHEHVLLSDPDHVSTPAVAVQTACLYWKNNGLNDIADKPASWRITWKGRDITAFEWMTVRINGGLEGLQSRRQLWQEAKESLKI